MHWNGITNKKKGQKWGKEKTPSWKRNNSNVCTSEPLQLLSETEQPKTPVPVVGSINFDELRPYTGLPQVWFAQIASICFLKCLVGHARFAKWNNQVMLAVLIKLHFIISRPNFFFMANFVSLKIYIVNVGSYFS